MEGGRWKAEGGRRKVEGGRWGGRCPVQFQCSPGPYASDVGLDLVAVS